MAVVPNIGTCEADSQGGDVDAVDVQGGDGMLGLQESEKEEGDAARAGA